MGQSKKKKPPLQFLPCIGLLFLHKCVPWGLPYMQNNWKILLNVFGEHILLMHIMFEIQEGS